jgi:uncharacterized damage-inducible protein DinB
LTVNDVLLNLVAHMRWADAMFADALDRDPSPTAEALGLFAHIASVEHLWYSRIHGETPAHAVWPALTVTESRGLAAEHADLLESLVLASDDAALSRTIHYRNSAGHEYENSIRDIVTHVATHGVHHRGQLARMLRASGQAPPYTDYIQFARRDQTA